MLHVRNYSIGSVIYLLGGMGGCDASYISEIARKLVKSGGHVARDLASHWSQCFYDLFFL